MENKKKWKTKKWVEKSRGCVTFKQYWWTKISLTPFYGHIVVNFLLNFKIKKNRFFYRKARQKSFKMSYKWFLKKSIYFEIFDFFHNPPSKISLHFKWLLIKNYLSSQSDVWCILKIILLSTRKNKNKIFLLKKVGGV